MPEKEQNIEFNKQQTMIKGKRRLSFLLIVVVLLCSFYLQNMKYSDYQDMEYEKLPARTRNLEKEEGIKLEEDKGSEEEVTEKLSLYANAAALLDGENGRVLWDKEGEKILPMASTTKIMTCIVALEYGREHPLTEEWVEVSSYAASQPKVKAGLKKGEFYRLSDLLYSMMLESHNDTAVAVAEHIGKQLSDNKSEKLESKQYIAVFADCMDEKARKLGCVNTNFVTPNGLDGQDERGIHATTAIELGKIAAYAMKNEEFRTIIQAGNYTFTDQKGQHIINVYNKNAYLTMEDGACGIKTGFTNGAGYCFVGAYQEEDKLLISVVLGCGWPPEKSKKWVDTKKLMEYGRDNYERQTISYHPVVQYLCVKGGEQNYCIASSQETAEEKLLLAPWEKIEVITYSLGSIQSPVNVGDVVGYRIYLLGDRVWRKIPICATERINTATMMHFWRKIVNIWLL